MQDGPPCFLMKIMLNGDEVVLDETESNPNYEIRNSKQPQMTESHNVQNKIKVSGTWIFEIRICFVLILLDASPDI